MYRKTKLVLAALFLSLNLHSQTVVINELMASNSTTMADPSGEFDDWIEIYNNSSQALDISGYFLSDNPTNLNKWDFPAGTVLLPNGYLIVWADEDSSQGPYHANYKLSATAEQLILSDPSQSILDSISWGQQVTDMGFARVPNGTGNFIIQQPTFSANNNLTGIMESGAKSGTMVIYPNPADGELAVSDQENYPYELKIYNALGKIVYQSVVEGKTEINTSTFQNGIYHVQYGVFSKSFIIQH